MKNALIETINQEFGWPFLPKGLVHATLERHSILSLKIGRRDVQINLKTGKVISAGTQFFYSEKKRR